MSTRPEPERYDWTDVDLLTREEAGERILAEIAETRARLDAATVPEEREALERRLSALRAWAGGPSAH